MAPKHIKLAISAATVLIGGGAIATTANIPSSTQPDTTTIVEQSQPKIQTKTETKVVEIPYETSYVDDANLPKGQTKIITKGQNGTKTEYYTVTYEDGVVTERKLSKTETTISPTTEVIARGTYVPPQPKASTATNCENGTYVNSAGNTVCRPSRTNTGGATAICEDGTYSYSQSRRGTCSHHGGVQSWL